MPEYSVGAGVGSVIWDAATQKLLTIYRVGSHAPQTWSVPGGWMEFGESWEDTAEREVREETGLVVSAGEIVGVTNDVWSEYSTHSVTLWIECEVMSGEAKVREPERCPVVAWHTLDELEVLPLFGGMEVMLPMLKMLYEGGHRRRRVLE